MASESYDGHATKRQRTDANGYSTQQGHRDSFDDPHKTSASVVVHVRALSDTVVEADLIDAVQAFGSVRDVFMMPRKRQALIEFEDLSGATNLINYSQTNRVYIGGKLTHFNYSTSQKIQRHGGTDEHSTNSVLLFTILNPQYPVTVDVMHTICSSSGPVNRIVVFKKNGVQAMVEFADEDSARKAKQSLNGADVYSGCCTLKIEYARPTKLNVMKNDSETWDYTNPNMGKDLMTAKGQPLLAEPRYGAGPTPYGVMSDMRRPPMAGGYAAGGGGMEMDYGQTEMYDRYAAPPIPQEHYPPARPDAYSSPRSYGGGPMEMSGSGGQQAAGGHNQQGSVLMIYGLIMDSINCTKLFNLLCLYGNVVRIKFLRSKEGAAMIQLADNVSCERAVRNLNGISINNSKIQLGFSKQAFLQEVQNPHDLPDSSASFMDFNGNRNNRFSTPEAAAKNRIQQPSQSIYYFNAPPGLSEDEMKQCFVEAGAAAPSKMKIFPSKNEKSSTGLLEWESISDTVEALMCCNHIQIPNPTGKYPYTLKLCFSANPIMG